jgi:hypothetical protein
MAKKKWFRKLADPLGLPDPMDVYGEKAAAAEKSAKESAAADRAAIATSATTAPTLGGDDVSAAREAERQRKLALAGQNSTILTGAGGLTSTSTGGKTLLGQ